MLSLISLVALTYALMSTGVSAIPTEDWKIPLGWDGVTLKSTDIGTPLNNNNTGLQKRATDGVFICADINWGKPCGYAQQPLNECIVLGSDWENKISSFGPDPGQQCIAYSVGGCFTGEGVDTWVFTNPGDATGGLTSGKIWNDRIQAWECTAI